MIQTSQKDTHLERYIKRSHWKKAKEVLRIQHGRKTQKSEAGPSLNRIQGHVPEEGTER